MRLQYKAFEEVMLIEEQIGLETMTARIEDEVRRSWKWLGHRPLYTELNALHPDYRPGRGNYEWNKERRTWPVIAYVAFEDELVSFVNKYARERMVCFGLNRREGILLNEKKFIRSALDIDILFSQNLLFDFDFEDKKDPQARVPDFELFLKKADDYFRSQELKAPGRAFTRLSLVVRVFGYRCA